MPEEEKKSVRGKAGAKVAGGIAMMVLSPITSAVGFGTAGLGAATAIIGGAGAKLISMASSNPDTKDLWQKRGQRARSFGTKAFLGGSFLCFPFIAGPYFMLEGGAQAIANDDSYGMWPALKGIARFTSGGLPQPGDLPMPAPSPPQRLNHQPHLQPNQRQLQTPVISLDTASITRAANFEEATQRYHQEVTKTGAQKYIMVGDLTPLKNGGYEAIYIHPKYKGDPAKCPEDFKVKQTFNDKMELISANIGKDASCNLPPIKKGNSFDLLKMDNGNVIDCKASTQGAQSMRASGLNQTPPYPLTTATPQRKRSQSI